MKLLPYIFISLIASMTYSQGYSKDEKEELYIFVENDKFIGAVLGYKAYFSLNSEDIRFQSDNYYFKINFEGIDYQSLLSLGTPVNLDNKKIIVPKIYFKNISNCELHARLSLTKQIYIITSIPKDEQNKTGENKYMIWHANYAGTLKNVTYTNYINIWGNNKKM